MYKSKDLVKIGNKIKALRIKKGYTSAEAFAWESGISRSQYSKYERAENNMRIESLLKVLKALEVTPEEFFKGF
jgi:transcriptional regulator with XRE-family HTH domain